MDVIMRCRPDHWRRRAWVRARGCASLEPLDDDHAAAAAGAAMLWCLRLIGVGVGRFDGINGNYWQREQLASARDVVGAFAAGEQAIVADAMEACRQHVHEKAADELVGGERHDLVALATLEPVVLPFEGDAVLVACDQAAV